MDDAEHTAPAPVARRAQRPGRGFQFLPGQALSRSFSIFFRHLPILLLLGVLCQALPLWLRTLQAQASAEAVNEFLATRTNPGSWRLMGGPLFGAWYLAQLTLPLAFQAVITLGVFRLLRGESAQWPQSIVAGLGRLPAALGTGLLMALVITTPLVFLAVVLPGVSLFVLILAAYLMCMWFVAVQTTVVERANPFRALGRSAYLTQGARGTIFGIVLLLFGLPQIVLTVLQHVVFRQQVFLAEGEAIRVNLSVIWTEAGFAVFFGGLQAVVAAVIYHALRTGKEGVGVDELVRVFE
jgi:hypothetical protein